MNLSEMSHRLGVNIDLVQGAGGNTSEKLGGFMRIKASGFELQQAIDSDIFVKLDSQKCRAQIEAGFAEDLSACNVEENTNSRRPSIETALHCIMPHAVVAHTHSINTIAASIVQHHRENLASALEGYRWCIVPYAKPGKPLAEKINAAISTTECDVVILQSHGLVVGAQTPQEAFDLTCEIDKKLGELVGQIKDRPIYTNDAWSLIEDRIEGFFLPDSAMIQSIARSDKLGSEFADYSLFPDFAVFLGAGIAVARPEETARDASLRCGSQRGAGVHCVVFPGLGVALSESSTKRGAEANLEAFARLLPLLSQRSLISHLTREDERELIHWEAEAYRRSRDKTNSESSA